MSAEFLDKVTALLEKVTPIQELRDILYPSAVQYMVLSQNAEPLPDGRDTRNLWRTQHVPYVPLPEYASDAWVHMEDGVRPGLYLGPADIDTSIHLVWLNYQFPREDMMTIATGDVDFFGQFKNVHMASVLVELFPDPGRSQGPSDSAGETPSANNENKKKKKKTKKKKSKAKKSGASEAGVSEAGASEAGVSEAGASEVGVDEPEPVQNEPVQNEPVQNEPVQNEPVHKEPEQSAQKVEKTSVVTTVESEQDYLKVYKETYDEYEEASSSDEDIPPTFLRNNPFFMGEDFDSSEPKRKESTSSQFQKLSLDESDETPSESQSNQRDTESEASMSDANTRVDHKKGKKVATGKKSRTFQKSVPPPAAQKPAPAAQKPAETAQKPVPVAQIPAATTQIPAVTTQIPAVTTQIPAVTGQATAQNSAAQPPSSNGKLTHRQLKSRQVAESTPEADVPRALIPTLTAKLSNEETPESDVPRVLIPTITVKSKENTPEPEQRTARIPTLKVKQTARRTPERHQKPARIPTLRVNPNSKRAPGVDKTARIPLVQAQNQTEDASDEEEESQDEGFFDTTEHPAKVERGVNIARYGKKTQSAFLNNFSHGKSIAINQEYPSKQIKDLAGKIGTNLAAYSDTETGKESTRIYEELRSSMALKAFFAASEERMFSQYFPELHDHFTSFHKGSQNVARGLLEEFPFLTKKRNLEPTKRKDLAHIISVLIGGRPKKFAVSQRRQAGDDASIILILIRHWTGENSDALSGIIDLVDAYHEKYKFLANLPSMEENLKLLIDGFSGRAAIAVDRWYKEEFFKQPASAQEMIDSFHANVWSQLDEQSRIRMKAVTGVTERVRNKILSNIRRMGCQAEDFWEVQVIS